MAVTRLVLEPKRVTGTVGNTAEIEAGAFDDAGVAQALSLTYHTTNAGIAEITGISDNHLTVTLVAAGVAKVWVSDGAVVSDTVEVDVMDATAGKGRR